MFQDRDSCSARRERERERENLIALRSSGLCDGTDEVSLAAFAAQCRLARYDPDAPLFREEMPADGADVVISGRVKLRRMLGAHEAILWILRASDVLGLGPAVDGGLRSGDAVALEASELLFLPGGALREWMRSDARAACAIGTALVREVRRWHQYVEFRDGVCRARVCSVLLECAECNYPALSLEVLAAMVGNTPENVSRFVARLARSGVVRSGRQGIVVLDVERLRGCANEARR